VARRKFLARGRRRRALARLARLAALPVADIYGGSTPTDLARRKAPRWPSAPEEGGDFARLFPEAAHHAVGEADALLAGEMTLFGVRRPVRRPDGRFDFDLAATGPLAADFAGDPKFPWEAARLAALPRLGVAFAVTGRPRYVEAAVALLRDWDGAAPVGTGLHFSSALEVGIRLIALVQAFHFFRAAPDFAGEPLELLLRRIALEAAWLDGHRSVERVVAGNHLLGELAGAVVVDLLFPELGEERRLDENLECFARAVSEQVAPDGVSREQSTTYGRFVADFAAAVLATAAAAGRPLPEPLLDRVAALAAWLGAVTRPDGVLPLVGDNDGGRGADWGESTPSRDARGVVLALAALTGRAEPLAGFRRWGAAPARIPGGETAWWWTGAAGLSRLEALLGRAGEAPPWRLFAVGGHAVVNGDGGDYLFVRSGPFGHGLPKPSAHSHADVMAPVVSLGGRALLVDPGNYGYTTAGPARDAFRVEAAHSTLAFDGAPLAETAGPFRWEAIPAPGRLAVAAVNDEVRIEGRWRTGRGAVAADRTIVYNPSRREIRIEDTWSTSGVIPNGVVQRWRLPAGAAARPDPDGTGFQVRLDGGAAYSFRVDPPATLRVEEGGLAPSYASRVSAPILVVERPGTPSGRAVTTIASDGAGRPTGDDAR
jgi:hypothetical protein